MAELERVQSKQIDGSSDVLGLLLLGGGSLVLCRVGGGGVVDLKKLRSGGALAIAGVG